MLAIRLDAEIEERLETDSDPRRFGKGLKANLAGL